MRSGVHLGEREHNVVSVRAVATIHEISAIPVLCRWVRRISGVRKRGDAGLSLVGVHMRLLWVVIVVWEREFEIRRSDQNILVIRISGNEEVVFRIHLDRRAVGCDPEADGNGLSFPDPRTSM